MTNLLILSVGSNPIPNYIVAKYLLQDNRDASEIGVLPVPDKIMFVYSSDTEKFRDAIVHLLGIGEEACVNVNIEGDYRKFDKIKKKVKKKLDELGSIASIHLNYTGGTKPMAVAISSAVDSFENTHENNKIYSDLSVDTFKLILRNDHQYPVDSDFRSCMELKPENIFHLHTLEITKSQTDIPSSEFYKEDFIQFLFAKVKEYKAGHEAFFDLWMNWPAKKNERCNIKAISTLITYNERLADRLELPIEDDAVRLEAYCKKLKESVAGHVEFLKDSEINWQKLKDLKNFICGRWLEEYTFCTLYKLKKEGCLTDLAWNVVGKAGEREFELDVVAVKGCQTFVFTCTLEYDSPLCKGKAFEGVYRSEQIGGEHSKTILVCMADNYNKQGKLSENQDDKTIDNIQSDMSQFDAAQNFHILGSEQIKTPKDFTTNLKDILNS